MPKPVRIHDIEDDLYAAVLQRAGNGGITVGDSLRRGAARLASRPSMTAWLARSGQRPSTVSTSDVLATLDGWRGDWPDAGR